MKTPYLTALILLGALEVACFVAMPKPLAQEKPSDVSLLRVPQAGIQPQIARDSIGNVHLVFYSGDPSNGDVYYARSRDSGAHFSKPFRVNTQPGSAVALGNIRGARTAVGKNGRVYVVWNGSSKARPPAPGGKFPMMYTRLDDSGSAFEPERNLIEFAAGIDGGGAVAADELGNVYVLWHAPLPGGNDEAARRVWIKVSRDGGKTFDRERVAWDKPTGACGCCGLMGMADNKGSLYILFRSAWDLTNRDMYFLFSRDRGRTFVGKDISKWSVGYCVMSNESLSQDASGVLAAWETEKQVYFSRVDPRTGEIGLPVGAPGAVGNRKYPVAVGNSHGESLLAWTEGMAWKRGGTLSWQIFDKAGLPIGQTGHAEGVPAWSLIAAFARPDGGFTIVY
jgi:hypothetical protein